LKKLFKKWIFFTIFEEFALENKSEKSENWDNA